MNKTEHYNLNQWDPEDKVTRTDFNADNAKLDVALSQLRTAVDTKLDAATGNAAIAERCRFVCGKYSGNGAETQTIKLGFRPSVVFISAVNNAQYYYDSGRAFYYGGMLMDVTDSNYLGYIVEDGFVVRYAQYTYATNQANLRYFYFALR